MIRGFLLITTFFVLVIANNHKFSLSEKFLLECIEDQDFFKYKGNAIMTDIADLAAKSLSGRTFSTDEIIDQVKIFVRSLGNQVDHDIRTDILFWINLEDELLKAVTNCSDDSIIEYNIIPYDRVDPQPVPTFENESPIMALLLNHILVNWTIPPGDMIRTQHGRAILRSYANNAQMLLECALSYYENDFEAFRRDLRQMWFQRAQLYFDGRSFQYSYINHYYDPHQESINTFSNIHRFSLRSGYSFEIRNPEVPPFIYNDILYRHAEDVQGIREFDIYSRYARYGMTSEEYHIETHIDMFYRILLFFAELRAVGVRSNEDDTFEGTLPTIIMPTRLQEILTSDRVYRKYLLKRKSIEVSMGDSNNPIIENIARYARVREEYFFWIFNPHFLGIFLIWPKETEISTTTTSTTTLRTTSTTSEYEGSKKGSVCINKSGKHFRSKQPGTSPYSRRENSHYKSNTKNGKKFSSSCSKRYIYNEISSKDTIFDTCSSQSQMKNETENYGYFLHSDDSEQLKLPEIELLIFKDTLEGKIRVNGNDKLIDSYSKQRANNFKDIGFDMSSMINSQYRQYFSTKSVPNQQRVHGIEESVFFFNSLNDMVTPLF